MALAALSQDQHAIEFQALQMRWKCTTHPGKTCYKPSDEAKPRDHINLDPKALSDWATAIVNKAPFVDIESPPSGKEWDRILKPKVHHNDISGSNAPQQFSQVPIHNHIYMPTHSRHDYSPRTSPYYHRQSYNPFPSPPIHTPTSTHRMEPAYSSPIVVEHESWVEFDGDGLRAFIAHCERKFKVGSATGFHEAYLKLRDHEIQPDVMREKTVDWYLAMGIKRGIAERIVATFGKWYARLLHDIS